MPARANAVATARHFANVLFKRWRLSDEEQDTGALIVSELAANAAQHGLSDMTIYLTLHQDRLHIMVNDSGIPEPAQSPDSEADGDEHGRGLEIISALATSVALLRSASGWRTYVSVPLCRKSSAYG
ncbi:ATP-binding protein [Streptomyces chartreusis]|uniref:ATP-binding protein n=1 Tax=Streptomyces chartreusis TaxID=1969 RepID=UPI003D8BD339